MRVFWIPFLTSFKKNNCLPFELFRNFFLGTNGFKYIKKTTQSKLWQIWNKTTAPNRNTEGFKFVSSLIFWNLFNKTKRFLVLNMVKKPYELFNDFLKLFLETLKVSQSLISRNRPIKPKATERSCLSDVRRQILDTWAPPVTPPLKWSLSGSL